MNEIIIYVREASEGGYVYDIYESEDDFNDGNSVDGGLCTSTMINAIEMASEQAQGLLI